MYMYRNTKTGKQLHSIPHESPVIFVDWLKKEVFL